ncbi:RHS repeat protein, partial [Thermoactinomyces sp. AMNI-1]|nr:RHS repeat protein [Thermoactinomyces mirandus]
MVSNKGTGDGFVVSFSYSGERCYKLMGDSSLWKSLSQEIKLSGSAGAVLTVSGHSRVENPNPSGGMYGCIIETYLDDTKQETFTFHFDKSKTHDWQHQAAEIKATRSFDKVKVYYEYSQQSGAAWFDTAKVSVGSITTRHQYDANGNYEVKTTDPQGRVTESEYDTVGNQTSEKVGAHTTTFEYDGLDRLKKVIDAKNGITQYQYDANGNKTRVTNASDKETTYQYNEIDQVSRVTDANNQSTTYD